MPLLKMYFQSKDARSIGSLISPQQQSLISPQPTISIRPLGSSRTKPLLRGMAQIIQKSSSGCKSCGR